MDEGAQRIKLPLELLGAHMPQENIDVFGKAFEGGANESGEYEITIEPESGLLIKLSCALLRTA